MSPGVHRLSVFAFAVLIGTGAYPALAGDGKPSKSVSPEVADLVKYVAVWSVTVQHFSPLGERVGTANGTEEVTWILDRRAIQRTYSSTVNSTRYQAIGTLTWNEMDRRYCGVWFDNVSTTGPTTVSGEWQDETRTMIYTIESRTENGATQKHRIAEQFLDDETRVATTYLLKGDAIVKLMETVYKRAAPCPGSAGLRMIDEVSNTDGD